VLSVQQVLGVQQVLDGQQQAGVQQELGVCLFSVQLYLYLEPFGVDDAEWRCCLVVIFFVSAAFIAIRPFFRVTLFSRFRVWSFSFFSWRSKIEKLSVRRYYWALMIFPIIKVELIFFGTVLRCFFVAA